MYTSRLRTLLVILPIALVASLGGEQAFANSAHGDNRNVDIPVLNFFLHHTYEFVQYSGPGGSVNGFFAFGGGTTGCTSCNRFKTSNVQANAPQCIRVQGNLTYFVTGVCHQGTNRALQSTPIPFVVNWGGVKGAGLAQDIWCTYGATPLCVGAPC